MSSLAFAQPHADGGDLVLARAAVGAGWPVVAHDPDADAARAFFAAQIELGQGGDHPIFHPGHEFAHVAPARGHVQQNISHPLPRPVIGILPAAPGLEHVEPVGIGQVGGFGRGPRGIKGRVLQQPDRLIRLAARDCRGARFHPGHGIRVGHRVIGAYPFDHETRRLGAGLPVMRAPLPRRGVARLPVKVKIAMGGAGFARIGTVDFGWSRWAKPNRAVGKKCAGTGAHERAIRRSLHRFPRMAAGFPTLD